MLAGHFFGFALDGDFADLGSDRMLGDITEGAGYRLHQLVEKSLHLVAPQRTAAFHPVVLPVELRFAICFGQYLQELAEHEKAADAHTAQQDECPECDRVHEPIAWR
ncbi:hypothetical protein D3C75_1006350 [compost metagenome]